MPNLSRRKSFKHVMSGLAVVGLASADSAVSKPLATQASTRWVHGYSCNIGYPERLESASSDSGALLLRGHSYSRNFVHVTIELPAAEVRVDAVLVRYRTRAGASIDAVQVFDAEKEEALVHGLGLQQDAFTDSLVALAQPIAIKRALGVTLQVNFGEVDREIAISAVGVRFVG